MYVAIIVLRGDGIELHSKQSMGGGGSARENCQQALASENENVSVDIESLDQQWVTSIKQRRIHSMEIIKRYSSLTSDSCSIHRVPPRFRQHNEKAYMPQIISIGPFHYSRRTDDLQAMEACKWWYFQAILARNGEDCLERFFTEVKKLEVRARQSYSEEINLDSNIFVEMMVLDACFIIELLRKANSDEEHKDDPIFQLGWRRDNLMRDLVMLENQIPFFILKSLFDMMRIPGDCLEEMALKFFTFSLPKNRYDKNSYPEVQHLLHLMHSSLVPIPKRNTKQVSNPGTIEMIHSASDLLEAGIKFRKKKILCGVESIMPRSSFLDINFHKGEIEIPTLKVEDNTNPLFLNLIAFEQCYCHCDSYFSDYTYFMDCLINSPKDVQILCQNGIIDRWLGCNKDVATLFNKMGREIVLRPNDFYLSGVFDQVNSYCNTIWHVWGASLIHNYFYNPWAIISVLAAILLLFLTFTQTLFTIFPQFSYKPKPPCP